MSEHRRSALPPGTPPLQPTQRKDAGEPPTPCLPERCGQNSRYSSPLPLYASRTPPGNSSTASPAASRRCMLKADTGTAPKVVMRSRKVLRPSAVPLPAVLLLLLGRMPEPGGGTTACSHPKAVPAGRIQHSRPHMHR
jgi:hypothetical protein